LVNKSASEKQTNTVYYTKNNKIIIRQAIVLKEEFIKVLSQNKELE